MDETLFNKKKEFISCTAIVSSSLLFLHIFTKCGIRCITDVDLNPKDCFSSKSLIIYINVW